MTSEFYFIFLKRPPFLTVAIADDRRFTQNFPVDCCQSYGPCFSEETYALYVEAIDTLIVLLSVQMFDPDASTNGVFYQIAMTGKW